MNQWGSNEVPAGLQYDLDASSKSLFHRMREDSLSGGFKCYFDQSEEPCQPTNPFSNENTINFADIEKRMFSKSQVYDPESSEQSLQNE